jgi:hypothetical protein
MTGISPEEFPPARMKFGSTQLCRNSVSSYRATLPTPAPISVASDIVWPMGFAAESDPEFQLRMNCHRIPDRGRRDDRCQETAIEKGRELHGSTF